MASKEKQQKPEPEGKRHHVSFRTAGLVAELYPSYTQKQNKLGPIGRKKLQSHELKKKLPRTIRKRRSGVPEAYKDDDNGHSNTHMLIAGSSHDGLENKKMEANGLTDKRTGKAGEMSVTDSNTPLDGITGIPLESVWFGMGGRKKSVDEGNSGVGISQSVIQVSVDYTRLSSQSLYGRLGR